MIRQACGSPCAVALGRLYAELTVLTPGPFRSLAGTQADSGGSRALRADDVDGLRVSNVGVSNPEKFVRASPTERRRRIARRKMDRVSLTALRTDDGPRDARSMLAA